MANLYPLEEASKRDLRVGGFVVRFDSGATKVVHWISGAPITETRDAAQEYTTQLVAHLMSRQLEDDVRDTNWVSMVAAIEKVIHDWNARLRESLYAEGSSLSELPKAVH